ncbi:hypothetical protein NG726_11215 [Pseudomonas sp. MOB-449]|nr:hypothetical protein [Pseudomonas sp. MOB-449]
MRADREDAPAYLRSRSQANHIAKWAFACISAIGITSGALYWAGSAMPKLQVMQKVVSTTAPATQKGPDHWDRVVEEQFRKDMARSQEAAYVGVPTPLPELQKPKQTIFHDGNYIPRGAVNTISLAPAPPLPEIPPERRKMKVTIVSQEDKKSVCNYYKAGSVEKRNCRQYIGLKYRNK